MITLQGPFGSYSLPSVTWATKPVSPDVGQPYFISDVGINGSHWYYDSGGEWKPLGGRCLLASLDTTSAGVFATDTVVFQYEIPAGVWRPGWIVNTTWSVSKSGATNTGTVRGRIGTTGTTADTEVYLATSLVAAANRQYAGFVGLRLESDTTVQQLPNTTALQNGGSATAVPAAVTITDASANDLWVNFDINSSGATNSVSAVHAQMWLMASAN